MTEGLLMLGNMIMMIPIAMVLLSRVLNYRVNRWANIVVGVIAIAFVLANGSTDLDVLFSTAIGVAAMSLIVWYAWRWHRQQA